MDKNILKDLTIKGPKERMKPFSEKELEELKKSINLKNSIGVVDKLDMSMTKYDETKYSMNNQTNDDDDDEYLLTQEQAKFELTSFMAEFKTVGKISTYRLDEMTDGYNVYMKPVMSRLLTSFIKLYRNIELWSDRPCIELYNTLRSNYDKNVYSTDFYHSIRNIFKFLDNADMNTFKKVNHFDKDDILDFKNFIIWCLMESDFTLIYDIKDLETYQEYLDDHIEEEDMINEYNLKLCRAIVILEWVVETVQDVDDPVEQYSAIIKAIDGIVPMCIEISDEDPLSTHAYFLNFLKKMITCNCDMIRDTEMVEVLVSVMDYVFDLYSEVVPFAPGQIPSCVNLLHIQDNVEHGEFSNTDEDIDEFEEDIDDNIKHIEVKYDVSCKEYLDINNGECRVDIWKFTRSIMSLLEGTHRSTGVISSSECCVDFPVDLADKIVFCESSVCGNHIHDNHDGDYTIEELYDLIDTMLINPWYIITHSDRLDENEPYVCTTTTCYRMEAQEIYLRKILTYIKSVMKQLIDRKNGLIDYEYTDTITSRDVSCVIKRNDFNNIVHAKMLCMLNYFNDNGIDEMGSLEEMLEYFVDTEISRVLHEINTVKDFYLYLNSIKHYLDTVEVNNYMDKSVIADFRAMYETVVTFFDISEVDLASATVDLEKDDISKIVENLEEKRIDTEVQDDTGEDDNKKKIQFELSDFIRFSNMVSDCCYTCIINKKSSLSVLTSIQKSFHDMLSRPGFSNYGVIVGLSYMQIHELMITISENERMIFLNLNYFNTMVLGAKKFVSEILDTFVVDGSDTDLVFKISLENIERVLDLYIDTFNLNDKEKSIDE